MDDDVESETKVTPEVAEFLGQPISRIEAIHLVQPLRAAILSVFQGAMTSLAGLARQDLDSEIKARAKKSFDDLQEVFVQIDKFDDRLARLLAGKSAWASDDDQTNEAPTHE